MAEERRAMGPVGGDALLAKSGLWDQSLVNSRHPDRHASAMPLHHAATSRTGTEAEGSKFPR